MAEYIERDAAIEICETEYQNRLRMLDYCGDTVAWNIGSEIKALPAADVAPVVRCRDCKHYRTYMGHDMCAKNVKLLGGREVGLCATGKDDFCNYGERKNDE